MYKPCFHCSVLEHMLWKALCGSFFPWRFSYANLDVPLYITNSLFPTVDNFVAQCAVDAVFVILHWKNTRPCLRPCIVEAGLIHKSPGEFLFDDSITKLLFFLGWRATLRIQAPAAQWLGLHPFKLVLLLCLHKIITSLVLCGTVGVIVTFMYCRSISKAATMGYKEDIRQPMTLLSE